MPAPQIANPQDLADAGQKIYDEKLKDVLEPEHNGRFVAINVVSGDYYVDDFPERAAEKARAASATGLFHLVKIGAAGAFRVSYSKHAHRGWLFR